jgi:ribosomal protein S18 acetylase RimI-like enzyme
MAVSIKLAMQKGCKVLWLGVWENNHKAILFYQKWGFEIFGSHGFILGTD